MEKTTTTITTRSSSRVCYNDIVRSLWSAGQRSVQCIILLAGAKDDDVLLGLTCVFERGARVQRASRMVCLSGEVQGSHLLPLSRDDVHSKLLGFCGLVWPRPQSSARSQRCWNMRLRENNNTECDDILLYCSTRARVCSDKRTIHLGHSIRRLISALFSPDHSQSFHAITASTGPRSSPGNQAHPYHFGSITLPYLLHRCIR